MKVLQVDKFLRRERGGATNYMQNLAGIQRDAGHEVEFFAMADPLNPPATYERYFPSYQQTDPPPGGLKNQVEGFARMVWSRECGRCMGEVLDRFEPDIVHVHNIYHQLSPSILRAARSRNIPVVMTVHDFKLVCPVYDMYDGTGPCESCLGGNFTHAVRKRCMGGSLPASAAVAVETAIHRWTRSYGPVSTFIAPSRYLESRFRQAGVFPDRLRHVPNFVDVDTFTPTDGPGDGVLFIGRLTPTKGVDRLIDAVAAMGDTRLDIVGDGPVRAELEAQAVSAGVDAHFLGPLGKAEVAAVIARSRVVAIPSIWPENLPLVVIEALASGVPAVVTSIGGAAEMVDHGVDGMVTDPTVSGLVSALTPIVEDSELAIRMGVAARAKAEKVYGPSQHLQTIMAIYEEVRANT